jgi:anti-anti-sigma factor
MIDQKQPRKLVIDFSQVRFFSSQVLGLLVDIWRRVKEFGGCLTISGIDPQLTRVFRITHLDKLFTFYENTDSAIASMKVS